jgi:MoaA/NifB/PqqE/SkfB family radical SAM enzyme
MIPTETATEVPDHTRPGPWRITFDTNPDDCNLSCIMCEDHSPYSATQPDRRAAGLPRRRMDLSLVQRILEESRGTPLREIIPSTMGEPLLYRHFDRIIDLCAEYGVKLNLTTNGTFPGRGARAWAQRIVPVASDVKVSWNGATKETQETVMLKSNWDKVLENLRTFISVRDEHAVKGGNRCTVTLQLTFMEVNYRELPQVVKLASELGVDRVKGHHLWVHFDQISQLSMRRNSDAIARWNRTVEEAERTAERFPLPNGKNVLLDNIFPLDPDGAGDIAPGGVCPFLGKEAWVASDGRFNPCCAPDALRRTLGDFGNVSQQGLYDIWGSKAYNELRENYMQHSLCQGCNMRRPEER